MGFQEHWTNKNWANNSPNFSNPVFFPTLHSTQAPLIWLTALLERGIPYTTMNIVKAHKIESFAQGRLLRSFNRNRWTHSTSKRRLCSLTPRKVMPLIIKLIRVLLITWGERLFPALKWSLRSKYWIPRIHNSQQLWLSLTRMMILISP